MKYYIIAGEASGDLHGSNLIKGIKNVDLQSDIRCWGGDLMQQAGGTLVKHYKDTAIIGFWEVLKNLGKIGRNLKDCKKDIIAYNPDVVILIDYPGFNFRIAKFAHSKGIRVFYYIAPKIWAWKENRGERLKRYVDRLFIIFPFEIDYFKKRWQIDAIYRGNPLLDSINQYKYINESKEEFCTRTRLNSSDKFIALIAGSRKGEISYLLPRMIDVVRKYPDYKFLLALAPAISTDFYDKIIEEHLSKINLSQQESNEIKDRIIALKNETYSIMKHSDAAIVNSGTASLEVALIKTPQVVCYGASEITYQIAKRLVKGIKYISLANLILDKQIFKELIQHDCTPVTIANEVDRLLHDKEYRENMIKDYDNVREVLGGGGASNAVAEAIIKELKQLV